MSEKRRALVGNANDPAQVGHAGDVVAARAALVEADTRAVLATREGRHVVWELIREAGFFALSFAGEATHQTAFNEGRREVANRIIGRTTSAEYKQMQDDHEERDRTYA